MQKILDFKKLFKTKKKAGIIIIILLALIFGFWRITGKNSSQVRYQTAKVERGTLVSSVSASGQILSSNYLNVSTKASGIVKKVYVKDGDKVKAGQKIAEIELDREGQQANSQAYSSYLSAKNSLDSASVSLYSLDSAMWAAYRKFVDDALARGLANTDSTYIQEHDDWLAAEAKYKNQQNVIAQSQSSVANAWQAYQQTAPVIYAPNSGTISNITLVSGMVLASSTSSARIAIIKTEGKPLATFNLSEIDIPLVKQGQKAVITIDSLSDKTFTGKVASIDRIGTVTSGVTNYPVIIQFDTEVENLLPNMSANVSIIYDTKTDVLIVPSSAVKKSGGGNIVQILKNGEPVSVPVEIGNSNQTQIEIVSGLNEGDTVITNAVSSSAGTRTGSQTSSSPFGSFGGNIRIFGGAGR